MAEYVFKFIRKDSIDELDLKEPYYSNGDRNEVFHTEKADSEYFMPIEELKKILTRLEEKDATHVGIYFKQDATYVIEGVELKKA